MCLCAEYFLFAAVPVVQGRRPPAGRGALCRTNGAEPGVALPGVRDAVFSQAAQLPLLSRLCQETQTAEQEAVGEETPGACVEKVMGKGPEISGLFPLVRGVGTMLLPFSWKRHLLFLQGDTDIPLSFLRCHSVSFSYGFPHNHISLKNQ